MSQWDVSDLLYGSRSNGDRPPPTVGDIRQMLGDLECYWIANLDEENALEGGSDIMLWAAQRFGLPFETMNFPELDEAYKRRTMQLLSLQRMARECHDLQGDEEVNDTIIRMAKCIRLAYDSLRSGCCLFMQMDPARQHLCPTDMDVETIFQYQEDKLTSFQQLVMYFTNMLRIAEYRKVEDQCWKEIVNDDGYSTYAWRMDLSIKEFLYKCTQKEVNLLQWKNLTNPRDNADNVVRHLIESEHSEFMTIEVDRHKWSYENGIYDVNTDTFWKYEDEDEWKEQAARLQEYRRGKGWGDDYVIIPPDRSKMTVKYFDQPFRFDINPETEETFDPHDITLEHLDVVLDAQKLDPDTKDWVLKMLARLFYKVGEKDGWQVVFFIKGIAGSGKSTLAKLIRYMYPPNLITTLASNVEEKFGLSAIYKGLICICAEVKSNFGLDQADWQSAASGENMNIAIKNKTAIQHEWTTPFFFLGNEVMDYKDASGSVNRRIFMIEFAHAVRGSDPHLFDKLCRDIDLFHRKSVSLYLQEIRKNGHRDIWDQNPPFLTKMIYDFKANMRTAVDALYTFLTSGVFETRPDCMMLLKDFKKLYAEYRKDNNYDKCRWGADHYRHIFSELGLVIDKRTETLGERTVTGEYILGIQCKGLELAD